VCERERARDEEKGRDRKKEGACVWGVREFWIHKVISASEMSVCGREEREGECIYVRK